MKTVLKTSALCKSYFKRKFLFGKTEEKPVLKNINLELRENRVLGLVGESGCGKSTLCKVLLGIEDISSGTAEVLGRNIAQISKKQFKSLRRKMQVVFQNPYASLDPRMNIYQLLSEPLDIHGLYPKQAERKSYLLSLLADVGLSEEHLLRYPHEFSGGQRQRIAIARALVLKPQFLIADEPVSALDVSVQAQILNLLKQIQKERNLTMLFVTHDFAVARFLCDDIAVMYQGEIVEYAQTEDLFACPQHPYTQMLLDAVPSVQIGKKEQKNISEEYPNRKDWACPFAPRCAYAEEKCKKQKIGLQPVSAHQTCACCVLPFSHGINSTVTEDK